MPHLDWGLSNHFGPQHFSLKTIGQNRHNRRSGSVTYGHPENGRQKVSFEEECDRQPLKPTGNKR